jgi:hypothetical protein
MRHKQWDDILDFLDSIADRNGSVIHDYRCGKWWDVGQAVCAEAYGHEWSHDDVFLEWNERDDSEPPEPHYYECAKAMADGYVPDWMLDIENM